jgi:O-antigen/teichoic acid export membrane protein
MTLNYLDKERYGLWLTLSSVIGWFSLFDIGLGNGFRNKFAEAIAVKNTELAKNYVSTTFILLAIIAALMLVLFFAINPFLNWEVILNTKAESGHTLSLLAAVVFAFFALQFVFRLTTSVLLADQQSFLVDLIGVLGSLFSLAAVFVLMHIGERSLLSFCATISVCPVLALIIAYIVMFNGKYGAYKPSFKYVDFKQSKSLMELGVLFFVPQICSLIVFSTSNIIIVQIFTPEAVVVYNIGYKYFSIVIVFFNILIIPFWSAFTEAFVKKDNLWIKNVVHKLIIFWVISCFGVIVMILLSKWFFRLWLGEQITIPLQLTIGLAVYVCIHNWNNIFSYFVNGVSKIYLQVWFSIFAGVTFIPLTIMLSKKFGLIGVPLGMVLSIFFGTLITPIQCRKLISGTADGFWNK